jgi:hypothetical protein
VLSPPVLLTVPGRPLRLRSLDLDLSLSLSLVAVVAAAAAAHSRRTLRCAVRPRACMQVAAPLVAIRRVQTSCSVFEGPERTAGVVGWVERARRGCTRGREMRVRWG